MPEIYLIPCTLAEDANQTIPPYIMDAVKQCTVIFAENERTARRFLKSMDRAIIIDNFEWFTIHKAEEEQLQHLQDCRPIASGILTCIMPPQTLLRL